MRNDITKERILSIMEKVEGEKIVNEGIDTDYDNLTVAYNPSHQDNVDTSIENNPTMSNEYGDGVVRTPAGERQLRLPVV